MCLLFDDFMEGGILVVEDYDGCSVVCCFCCHLCLMDGLCGGVLIRSVG